ncbi:MAG: hypothetical protein R6U61_04805 [Thermoplasmata archaeon]
MSEKSLNSIEELLDENVGTMGQFVLKEQMKAACVDNVDPTKESLFQLIELIKEKCLLKLLSPEKAMNVVNQMKQAVIDDLQEE